MDLVEVNQKEKTFTEKGYEIIAEWNNEEPAVLYEKPEGIDHLLQVAPREVETAQGSIHFYNSQGEEVKEHQKYAKSYLSYQDTYTIIEDQKDYDPPKAKKTITN